MSLSPLTIEQGEASLLEKELEMCRLEILRLVEHYEELCIKQQLCQQKVASAGPARTQLRENGGMRGEKIVLNEDWLELCETSEPKNGWPETWAEQLQIETEWEEYAEEYLK